MSSLVIENKKSILPALSVMPQTRMKINVVRSEINPILIDRQIILVSQSSNLPRKSPTLTVMFNLSVKTVGSFTTIRRWISVSQAVILKRIV